MMQMAFIGSVLAVLIRFLLGLDVKLPVAITIGILSQVAQPTLSAEMADRFAAPEQVQLAIGSALALIGLTIAHVASDH